MRCWSHALIQFIPKLDIVNYTFCNAIGILIFVLLAWVYPNIIIRVGIFNSTYLEFIHNTGIASLFLILDRASSVLVYFHKFMTCFCKFSTIENHTKYGWWSEIFSIRIPAVVLKKCVDLIYIWSFLIWACIKNDDTTSLYFLKLFNFYYSSLKQLYMLL